MTGEEQGLEFGENLEPSHEPTCESTDDLPQWKALNVALTQVPPDISLQGLTEGFKMTLEEMGAIKPNQVRDRLFRNCRKAMKGHP